MRILENLSLKPFHTFRVDVKFRRLVDFTEEEEIIPFLTTLKPEDHPLLVLGEGSNLLFTEDFPGTIIRVNSSGISVLDETPDQVTVRVSGGVIWDEVVGYCVQQEWGGIENLSLIPGRAGAGPVQNIGAYGVELKDVLVELEAVHLERAEKRLFLREECRFGYRDSIFQSTLRGKYLILNLTIRLSKKPDLQLDYGSIRKELTAMRIRKPSIGEVREAICRIRRRKLPDPAKTGNAGSFFRNPVIRADQFATLKERFPDVVTFPDPDGVKLAAAWLIDQCGWKGRRAGDAGVHPAHSLVLVNYGKATGKEILELAISIRHSVFSRFGILLEPEVHIL